MPTDLRDFMVAMAVSQEFSVQHVIGSEDTDTRQAIREKDFSITFRLDEKFKYFESCLQVIKNVAPSYDYSGWDEWARGDFDCFIDFDAELAKKVILPTRGHITEGFGVLTGTYTNAITFSMYPQKHPILNPLMLKREGPSPQILIYDLIPEKEKLWQYLMNNYPELEFISITNLAHVNATPKDIIEFVNEFDFVIGKASALTYAAAALDKGLIEVFSTEDEMTLYNNYGLPFYRATLDVSAEYLFAIWEDLCQNFPAFISDTKDQSPQLLMELPLSTAKPAEEEL